MTACAARGARGVKSRCPWKAWDARYTRGEVWPLSHGVVSGLSPVRSAEQARSVRNDKEGGAICTHPQWPWPLCSNYVVCLCVRFVLFFSLEIDFPVCFFCLLLCAAARPTPPRRPAALPPETNLKCPFPGERAGSVLVVILDCSLRCFYTPPKALQPNQSACTICVAPSTVRPLARQGPPGPGWLAISFGFWCRVLVWTGACYWHGVGGFTFNSPSSNQSALFSLLPSAINQTNNSDTAWNSRNQTRRIAGSKLALVIELV